MAAKRGAAQIPPAAPSPSLSPSQHPWPHPALLEQPGRGAATQKVLWKSPGPPAANPMGQRMVCGISWGHPPRHSRAAGQGWWELLEPLCGASSSGMEVPGDSLARWQRHRESPVSGDKAGPCADSLAPLPAPMQPLLPPLTLPDRGAGPLALGYVLNSLESSGRRGERRHKLKTSGSVLGSN